MWRIRSKDLFPLEILTTVGINFTAFCGMTPYILVDGTNVSDRPGGLLGYPENGGRNFFRNIGTLLTNYTA
jgi:hypothetical protein